MLKQAKPELLIIVEGGIVQGIVSDNSKYFDGVRVRVIDYDVDGIGDDELRQVKADGLIVHRALVGDLSIGRRSVIIVDDPAPLPLPSHNHDAEHLDEDGECGHCDACGAPCDREGCTADRGHEIANDRNSHVHPALRPVINALSGMVDGR